MRRSLPNRLMVCFSHLCCLWQASCVYGCVYVTVRVWLQVTCAWVCKHLSMSVCLRMMVSLMYEHDKDSRVSFGTGKSDQWATWERNEHTIHISNTAQTKRNKPTKRWTNKRRAHVPWLFLDYFGSYFKMILTKRTIILVGDHVYFASCSYIFVYIVVIYLLYYTQGRCVFLIKKRKYKLQNFLFCLSVI